MPHDNDVTLRFALGVLSFMLMFTTPIRLASHAQTRLKEKA